jgi:hypothetical protein
MEIAIIVVRMDGMDQSATNNAKIVPAHVLKVLAYAPTVFQDCGV